MCSKSKEQLNIPGSIILDVVFLDFLNVVVCLRAVHALDILPDKVTQQTHYGKADRL